MNIHVIVSVCKSLTLGRADLEGADLEGADLRRADLRGAKNWQTTEWAQQCKRDILFVLHSLKSEVPNLKDKLIAGEVDGTQYEGDCACLVGTLGKRNGVEQVCNEIPFYRKGLHNYGEQFFWQIRKGDTPKNSDFAKIAIELCDMVISPSTSGIDEVKSSFSIK